MAKKHFSEMQLEHPLFRGKSFDKMKEPEQLDQLLTVTSLRGWLVLLALGMMLLAAFLWGILGTIQTSKAGDGLLVSSSDGLEVVLYVSPADGQRITDGMPVRVSPVTARKEEYGYLKGEVVSVGDTLSTQADMLATVGNDALVQSLVAAGSLVEVRVWLVPDATTDTGYAWTSAGGPPRQLQPGTPVAGNIIIEEQRPLEMVLPFKFK